MRHWTGHRGLPDRPTSIQSDTPKQSTSAPSYPVRGNLGDSLSAVRSMSAKPAHFSSEYSCPICRKFLSNNSELTSHLQTYDTFSSRFRTNTFPNSSPHQFGIRAYTDGTAEQTYETQSIGLKKLKALLAVFLVIPPSRISEYGSYFCRTQVGESDIDLSIDFPEDEIMNYDDFAKFKYAIPEKGKRKLIFDEVVLRFVQAFLEEHRYSTIFRPGRVKILQVKLPVGGFDVSVDLSINNAIAVRNSRLIAEYIRIYPQFRPLCLLVKHWAKRKGIVGAINKYLSSYSFTVILIHFLQVYKYVPNLQECPAPSVVIDGFECKFASNIEVQPTKESISSLFRKFFEFFCFTDWTHLVVCISSNQRKTHGMRRVSKADQRRWGTYSMWIEDPFDTTRNLGDVMQERDNIDHFKGEFRRALNVFESGGSTEDYFGVDIESFEAAFNRLLTRET